MLLGIELIVLNEAKLLTIASLSKVLVNTCSFIIEVFFSGANSRDRYFICFILQRNGKVSQLVSPRKIIALPSVSKSLRFISI